MRLRRSLAVAVLLTCFARPGSAQAVRYEVSIASAAAHLFHVKADFPTTGTDTLLVSLPAWSPGNYEIQNYARFVRHFAAQDASGKPLFWDRLDKDTWRIGTGGTATVTVAFDFLADEIDLSRARLVSDFGEFLGTNLFLYQEGHLERPGRGALRPAGGVGRRDGAGAPRRYVSRGGLPRAGRRRRRSSVTSASIRSRWAANGSGSRSGPRPTTRPPWPTIFVTASPGRPRCRTR